MKTKQIVGFGILAVMLMLVFTACGDGSDDSNGMAPLAGKWYRKIDSTILVFEITSVGKFIMADTTYDISVAANTATLTFGGTAVGTFSYAISNGEMVITEGTGIGITIAAFSPVVKISTFTVTFNPNGGTGYFPPITVASGSIMGAQYPIIAREGYTFLGWYDETVSPAQQYSQRTPITKNVTLTARWQVVAVLPDEPVDW